MITSKSKEISLIVPKIWQMTSVKVVRQQKCHGEHADSREGGTTRDGT
jgi:hypothetical protein